MSYQRVVVHGQQVGLRLSMSQAHQLACILGSIQYKGCNLSDVYDELIDNRIGGAGFDVSVHGSIRKHREEVARGRIFEPAITVRSK